MTYMTSLSTLPRCDTVNGVDLGTLFNQYQASVFLSDFDRSDSDESLQGLNTKCPTGNCKYTLFSSLAIRSETTDLYPLVDPTRKADGTLDTLSLPNGLCLSDVQAYWLSYNGSTILPTLNYEEWAYEPLAKFTIM